MFRVYNDTRIIMTSVTGYDRKSRTCIPAPGRRAMIFHDEKELIRYLAGHTDTHGYADPARWSNSLITRQYSAGRAVRVWTESIEGSFGRRLSWTENWEYWFHDTGGRTTDVRRFRAEVIAAVRRGETSGNACTGWKGNTHQGRRRHSVYRMAGQRGRVGFYLRSLGEETNEKRVSPARNSGAVRGRLFRQNTIARTCASSWSVFIP